MPKYFLLIASCCLATLHLAADTLPVLPATSATIDILPGDFTIAGPSFNLAGGQTFEEFPVQIAVGGHLSDA